MSDFKFTIAIEKAEEANGELYLYGVATGLGLDSQGHEMDPSAIEGFSKQIAARAETPDPVPFMDWHQKDGILKQLGDVVEGQVDADYNLGVKVRLDKDNPAAVYLHKAVKKGKKFGMSVAGKASGIVRRFDEATKQAVLRFTDVAMTEVSATTKPIWTPSLGTVLAKSVIDEASAESLTPEGDSPEMSKNDTEGLNEEATTTAPADETATANAAEAEATTDIEKAGARYSKSTKAKFLAMYEEMGQMLREEGILDEEPEVVEKAESTDAADEAGAEKKDEADTSNDTTTESDSDEAKTETPSDEKADAAPAADAVQAGLQALIRTELERLLKEMTARPDSEEAASSEEKAKKGPQMVVSGNATAETDADRERKRLEALPPRERLVEAFRIQRG